jgi:hypothetical protein
MKMIENPKNDPNRLARVGCDGETIDRLRVAAIPVRAMVDWVSITPARVIVAQVGRLYKFVYLKIDDGVPMLVDDWDTGASVVTDPVAYVYCTSKGLLKWTDAVAIRGDIVERGRLELHEHVKRMDAYMKAMVEDLSRHEFTLEGVPNE